MNMDSVEHGTVSQKDNKNFYTYSYIDKFFSGNLKDKELYRFASEMIFKISKDLKGENLPDDVLIKAIDYISPGIELHNFKFWYMPPTLQELVCSNGLHAGLIVGDNKISPENGLLVVPG